MDTSTEAILIECLSALEEGEPLEEILARYPEDAAWLRVHLQTALALARLRPDPHPGVQARSRAAFLAQAAEMREAAGPVQTRRPLLRLPALEMLAILILVLGVGVVGVASASSALPGSALYGAKLQIEGIRLGLAADDAAREELRREFEQERMAEIHRLLLAGQVAEVEFGGTIQAIAPDEWTVAGLPVLIGETTAIRGTPAVGLHALVRGQTGPDGVLAAVITIEAGAPNTATPLPNLTRQPPVRSTEKVAPTGEAQSTNTPAATTTPSLPTIAPATATPVPPTIAPPPPTEDNGNDNSGGGGDDNENENDNSDDEGGGDDNSNDNSGDDDDNSGHGGGGDDDDGGGGDD